MTMTDYEFLGNVSRRFMDLQMRLYRRGGKTYDLFPRWIARADHSYDSTQIAIAWSAIRGNHKPFKGAFSQG